MLLSIVIPVYNEEELLPHFVNYLMNSECSIKREFIFVNDCSSDGSLRILQEKKKHFDFTIINQNVHAGKGAAVRKGIEAARGNIIMIQDADFEYDVEDVEKLIRPLINDKADVVYGSRFKKSSAQVHRTYHYFVNRFLTLLSNLFSGIYLTDMETCYKVFRADLLKSMNLKSNRFGIEIELTAYIAKTSCRIQELPINYYPRTKLEGKKIGWQDGAAALFHLIVFNFFVSKETAFQTLPGKYDSRIRVLTT